jgi:putative ABC transport system permease protein
MVRVALRDVRAHVVRFALSVLAVLLGVAFVAGTFALRAMLSSTFDQIIATSLQGDAYLRGAQESASRGGIGEGRDDRTRIPARLAETAREVDGVAAAFPDLSGPIVLVGADGTAVQSGSAPSFGIGLHPDDPAAVVVAGRTPSGAGEIALEDVTAANAGLALGDVTTVVVGGQVRPVSLVGEIDTGAPSAGATLVFLDPATAQAAYAPDGLVGTVTVYGEEGVAQDDLVDALAAAVAGEDDVEAVSGEDARAEATAQVNEVLGFIGTFLLVFAGISLFVGGFIIANTFAMSVRQRQREFALLRAVGASPAQVFASVLAQAAVVGIAGSALGVLAGLALVSVLRAVLARMGMNLSGEIPLEPATVAFSIVVGTVVSVVAAAVPARRAALVPPVEAMRDDVVAEDRSLRVRAVAGTVLVVGGVSAVGLAANDLVEPGGTWLGVGALAVLVAVLLLAPVIARTALGVLAAPVVAAVRPLGRLARGNVTRNPRRTANTAGALMVGMALVGATTVLASTAQASTRDVVETESLADLVVQSASFSVPAAAVAAVASLPSVARADAVSLGSALVEGPGDAEATGSSLVGIPEGAAGRTLRVEVTDGTLAGFAAGDAAVQATTAQARGWRVGDRLTLTSDRTRTSVRVAAIIDSQILGAPVVLPQATLEELLRDDQWDVTSVFLLGADGVDLADLRPDVIDAVKPFAILSVQTNDELATSLADQVDRVLVILYALLGLSVVIAVLGIVNTLALSVIERTREIGLLRAVGLGRLQLAGTVTIESVLTALFGTVVGVGVGVALAAAMPAVFADVGLSTLSVPWPQLAAMLVLAVVVGVLAALWPGARAARLPVLQAIAQE